MKLTKKQVESEINRMKNYSYCELIHGTQVGFECYIHAYNVVLKTAVTLYAEIAEFEEIIRLKNGLIFQLVERCEKAETSLEKLSRVEHCPICSEKCRAGGEDASK